jgi:hypothetical protein
MLAPLQVDRPVAAVEQPEGLDALTARISSRQTRISRISRDHLDLVKQQAADVLAARQLVKHGEWGPWCKRTGLSVGQAWRYYKFGETLRGAKFAALTEDQQWDLWHELQGHRSQLNGQPDPTPASRTPSKPAPPSVRGDRMRATVERWMDIDFYLSCYGLNVKDFAEWEGTSPTTIRTDLETLQTLYYLMEQDTCKRWKYRAGIQPMFAKNIERVRQQKQLAEEVRVVREQVGEREWQVTLFPGAGRQQGDNQEQQEEPQGVEDDADLFVG